VKEPVDESATTFAAPGPTYTTPPEVVNFDTDDDDVVNVVPDVIVTTVPSVRVAEALTNAC